MRAYTSACSSKRGVAASLTASEYGISPQRLAAIPIREVSCTLAMPPWMWSPCASASSLDLAHVHEPTGGVDRNPFIVEFVLAELVGVVANVLPVRLCHLLRPHGCRAGQVSGVPERKW